MVGVPSSTGVSHVPQVPSPHEDSTPTPASSTTERMDWPGRDGEGELARASSTSNASVSTGSVERLGENRSTCRAPFGHAAQRSSTASRSGSGPQQYTLVSGCGSAEQTVEVEQARLVLRPHRNPVAVRPSSSRKAIEARCRPP